MTVVVNEFDVVPAPREAAAPAPTGSAETPGRLSPAMAAGIERALLVRAERRRRLEAD